MPEALRVFSEICPACGDGAGIPVSRIGSAGEEAGIHLRCENCENRWSVSTRPGPSSAPISQMQLHARLDSVIRLRPKLDRRATPRS